MLRYVLGLLLSISQLTHCSSSQDKQALLVPSPSVQNAPTEHVIDKEILAALKTHSDPVAALLALQPENAGLLAEPRLLHVSGDQKPEWMTEGDKLRLRRRGKKFVDITDHRDFYAQQVDTLAGKASKSLFTQVHSVLLFTLLQTFPT
jgi:leucyl aminopeptidase